MTVSLYLERLDKNLFSGFLFATSKVAYITVMSILHLILHSAVHIYDVHIFKNFTKNSLGLLHFLYAFLN